MMHYYKSAQGTLDANKLLTFPGSVGALWPSVPGPAWYHWLQNHHSGNCKKNIFQTVQSTSVKQIKLHKPMCGKHQRDPVEDYEENWGAQHLTLSLVPSENPLQQKRV